MNHLRGNVACRSCGESTSYEHSDCPSCQHGHGIDHQDGYIDQGVMQPSPSPTPAAPRVLEGDHSPSPSNAQQRMRLHQRPSQADPNGKLSAQLVNGHKRLVSNP
jgi:hypothetical protein